MYAGDIVVYGPQIQFVTLYFLTKSAIQVNKKNFNNYDIYLYSFHWILAIRYSESWEIEDEEYHGEDFGTKTRQ